MEKTNKTDGKTSTDAVGVTETETHLEVLAGKEVWTNAFGERFGERVCILVEDGKCWNNGKQFIPTEKEVAELWNDYIENELGGVEDDN